MSLVAISGSWRKTNETLKSDLEISIKEIFSKGLGIVTGGALGVDYIATEAALKLDEAAEKILVILPTPLKVYAAHFFKRASEGVISYDQADQLTAQLNRLKSIRPASLREMGASVCNEETYYARNTEVIQVADELYAFRVNQSAGTTDAINKAYGRKIPVKVFDYQI